MRYFIFGTVVCVFLLAARLPANLFAADTAASPAEAAASLPARYAAEGTLILTPFVSAPFPHPARAGGHLYHGQMYSAAEHYSDSTVALFIPKYFHPGATVDFVVHFHGWRHTVAGTLPEYKLIEQFMAAGRNAILIVPQGPYNVPDSFEGKLEDTNGFSRFMAEAMEKLEAAGVLATNVSIGKIILSSHSGGYEAVAAIVDHGGLTDKIREVWLFDSLYAGTEKFTAWQKAQDGRFLDLYTDHGGTEGETGDLMASLRTNGVPFFFSEDTNAVPDNLRTNRLVFLHTDMEHNDTPVKRGTFREFLETSCLSQP